MTPPKKISLFCVRATSVGWDGLNSRMDWFWIKHGLLFPSIKRENDFFDYQTTSNTFSVFLIHVLGLGCIAGLILTFWAFFIPLDSSSIPSNRSNQFPAYSGGLSIETGEAVIDFLLLLDQCVGLIACALGSFIKSHRHRLWSCAGFALFLWIIIYALNMLLHDFGV